MKKSLVIGLLLTLALVVSGFTYAFWASGIAADSTSDTTTIVVGTGTEVSSTVSLSNFVNSQGLNELVPAGFVGAGQTASLTLTYDVDWASTGLDASGLSSTLTVTVVSVENESSADVSALFNFTSNGAGTGPFTFAIVSDGATVQVILTVTMNEPADQAAYNSVAGQDISVELSFGVAAA